MGPKFDRLIVLGITSSLASSFLKRYGSGFQSVLGLTRMKENQSDFSKQHLKTISSYCRGCEIKHYVDDGTDNSLGKWTSHPFTGSWMLGTERAYPRWKLRELAGFTDVPQSVKDQIPFDTTKQYSDTMKKTRSNFSVYDLDERVTTQDARGALLWVQQNKDNYAEYTERKKIKV